MHCHAERQHLAAPGVARAYVGSGRCAMPATASVIWSTNAAFLGAKQVDRKTEPPRRDRVSTQ